MQPAFFDSLAREWHLLQSRLLDLLHPAQDVWADPVMAASTLRQVLRDHLPAGRAVGAGYICPDQGPALEADLLVWTADTPRYYQEGDRVMLGPAGIPLMLRVARPGEPLVRQLARLHALREQVEVVKVLLIPPDQAPAALGSFLSGVRLPAPAAVRPHLVVPGREVWRGLPGGWEPETGASDTPETAMSWLLRELWEVATQPLQSPAAPEPVPMPVPAREVAAPVAVAPAPKTMNRELEAAPAVSAPVSLPMREVGKKRPPRPDLPAEQPDQEGLFPLHRAVLDQADELLIQLLDHGASPAVKDRAGNSPLHLAARYNRLKMAEALLEAGADPNARNFVYAAPLHVAVDYGHLDIVRLLVTQGAEVEARNNRAYTPLHKAAQTGNLDAARFLIEHYADIHACMERDIQPLHLAAWYGHTAVVDLLIAHGASRNATNADGNTPLHFAAFNGQVKAIKALINHEADPGLRNHRGETYLQGINEGYQGEMIRVLE